MAEIDTSFYPRSDQNKLLDMYATAQGIANAQAQRENMLLQNKRQQVGLSSDELDLSRKKISGMLNVIAAARQNPIVGTPEGPAFIRQQAQQYVDGGGTSQQAMDVALRTMPADPSQMAQWLRNAESTLLTAQERIDAIEGRPTMLSDGTLNYPVSIGTFGGMRPIGEPFLNTISPSERARPQEGKDEGGRPIIMPTAEALRRAGYDPVTGLPVQGDAQGGGNWNNLTRSTGAPASRPGEAVMGPSAGDIEAMKEVGATSGRQLAADTARETTYQADIFPYRKALENVSKLSESGTGPTSEAWNELKSLGLSVGAGDIMRKFGFDTDAISAYQEAQKYLTQMARSSGNTGTNDQLAAALQGNPTMKMAKASITTVLKSAIALRNLQNAGPRLFEESGLKPSEYSKWATKFNSEQDPVAFGFDMMTPEEQSKYFASLKGAAEDRFLDSLQIATDLGLVAPPAGR